MNLTRPLDKIPSLKLKLSIIIVAAIGVTVMASTAGFYLGIKPRWSILASVLLALGMVQILAKGTTSRLRQMANSAEAMAEGDYSERFRVPSMGADEVGELSRSLNRLAADLEDLERQRRELIANVSHELRTPLTAIHGNLENLVDGVTEPTPQLMAAMLAQTERLNRLVRDLLNISRFDAGQLPLEFAELPIAPLLDDIAAAAQLRSPRPNVVVEAPAELTVVADGDRLRQVFTNLFDNACRFSPADQPITLAANTHNDMLRISVTDLGPGIPVGERERIFERFHRIDVDRSTQTGGTGLGLAIAKSIVDAHGGTIHAEDVLPHGCRMVVTLPLARQNQYAASH